VTKAKFLPRQAAAPPEESDLDVPDAWRRRPWIPVLIMGILIAAVFGAGEAMNQALKPVVPAALAGCKTSTQLAPHQFSGAQPICIAADGKYQATISTTQGQIVVKLLPDRAPVTVNNFIVLAVNGYYTGLSFWKAEGWVLQGGDPNGDGRGGPGYTLPEEPTPDLTWDPGALGMARAPGGPVNGSQFFIVKSTWPGKGPTAVYNRFGTVVSGLDKAQAVAAGDLITSITIKVT